MITLYCIDALDLSLRKYLHLQIYITSSSLLNLSLKQEKTDKRKTGFSINRVCVPDIWE